MDDDKIMELAPLYALGYLEGEERARFEKAVAGAGEEAQAELSLSEALAHLVSSATVPPRRPGVECRRRLMQKIGERKAVQPWEVPHEGFEFLDADAGDWIELPLERGRGRMKTLFVEKEGGYSTTLLEFGPDSILFEHHHAREEQGYVIEGDLVTHGKTLGAGDFFRAVPGSEHGRAYTKTGCKVLIIAGHGAN